MLKTNIHYHAHCPNMQVYYLKRDMIISIISSILITTTTLIKICKYTIIQPHSEKLVISQLKTLLTPYYCIILLFETPQESKWKD